MALGKSQYKVPNTVVKWVCTRSILRGGTKGLGAVQHSPLASMRTNIFWKRLCYYSGEAARRIARITADTEKIRRIGTTLLTMVEVVVAISKVISGGICWRQWGTTTNVSLEAWWLVEVVSIRGRLCRWIRLLGGQG